VKRKIAVFTGTRAEYGLLYWLMKRIQASERLALQLLVSGTHLSPEFGNTWRQIEADGFSIDAKVDMLVSADSAVGVVKSMGLGAIGFADALERMAPDVLVVLGDRYETLTVVQTALVLRIPVAHLHGGEITEGAYDDAFRHAITKMSTLHFTSTELYRKRVIQMGEAPATVFNVGALGLDHLLHQTPMGAAELAADLDFDTTKAYFVVTYHPATQSAEDPAGTAKELLTALEHFPNQHLLLTYPNGDNGGRAIIAVLEAYAAAHPGRATAVPSLGFRRYLGALARASAVIGNSSSGIIEAPSFGVPTVDIGARQGGRLAAASVIHCDPTAAAIQAAIAQAISPAFRAACSGVVNPYGRGDAAGRIVQVIEAWAPGPAKRFHDLGGAA
jgi:UDP-N-acetylglucosamine 2-epimerase (non-hydrolysing)